MYRLLSLSDLNNVNGSSSYFPIKNNFSVPISSGSDIDEAVLKGGCVPLHKVYSCSEIRVEVIDPVY